MQKINNIFTGDNSIVLDNRPLLKGNTRKTLEDLLKKRLPFYKESDIVVNVDNKTPCSIVEEILYELNKKERI